MVPKVNEPIWNNIPQFSRSRDLKLQRIQKPLIKGLTALAKLSSDTELTDDLKESFLLLSTANFELNSVRKEFIKPDLNPQLSNLCKPSNKVTKWLFGDDLGKQVKEMQEEMKATSGVMKHAKTFAAPRYKPYPMNKKNFNKNNLAAAAAAAGWTKKQSFLGKGFARNAQQQHRQKQHHSYQKTTNQANQAKGQTQK